MTVFGKGEKTRAVLLQEMADWRRDLRLVRSNRMSCAY